VPLLLPILADMQRPILTLSPAWPHRSWRCSPVPQPQPAALWTARLGPSAPHRAGWWQCTAAPQRASSPHHWLAWRLRLHTPALYEGRTMDQRPEMNDVPW